jgi:hypothetical protein
MSTPAPRGRLTAALIKKRAGAFDLEGVFKLSLHGAREFVAPGKQTFSTRGVSSTFASQKN